MKVKKYKSHLKKEVTDTFKLVELSEVNINL